MQISYKRLIEPNEIIGPLACTQGGDIFRSYKLSLKTWEKLIKSAWGVPHSPLRVVIYRFYITDLPYYVHVHLVRHHIGVQFYVQSQRGNSLRAEEKQDALINVIMDINANSLINMAKARLCKKAAKETRLVLKAIKFALINNGDKYDKTLAKHLCAPCEIYNQCFEPKPCGKLKENIVNEINIFGSKMKVITDPTFKPNEIKIISNNRDRKEIDND